MASKVVQTVRRFDSAQSEEEEHQPTQGVSYFLSAEKAFQYVSLMYADVFGNSRFSFGWDIIKRPEVFRFVNTTLNRKAQLLSNENLVFYVDLLKRLYPEASVAVFMEGLNASRSITEVDPYSVIVERHTLTVKKIREEEEWLAVKKVKIPAPKCAARKILYPFVFPPKYWGFPHVVLIAIDRDTKEIYYCDSNGLTADDASRKEIFIDDPTFDMHENLSRLAEDFFPNDASVRIISNIAPLQSDPFFCAVFVARAIERIFQGMSIDKALVFNPIQESISSYKEAMGRKCVEHLKLKTNLPPKP